MQKKSGKRTKILFVTSNIHKFREAERILKEYGISIAHFPTRYPEVRADDCGAVASVAAFGLYRKLKQPLILEDAGLFIRSLNGFPGAYSAWAQGKLGNRGILKLMKGAVDRRAEFHSVYAFATSGGVKLFEGVCKGKIANAEKGEGGFGYDPIFIPVRDETWPTRTLQKQRGVLCSRRSINKAKQIIPAGHAKTFAEDTETKALLSHRRKALEKLARYLKKGEW